MATDAIFRKAALERLASPEQLDQALDVVSPRSWLSLGAMGILVLAAVVFSFNASIPTRVAASGILIAPGGVMDVAAPADGQVATVTVKEGATVRRGQLIATLAQPELARAAGDARSRVQELRSEHARVASFGEREARLQTAALSQKQAILQASATFYDGRLRALREKLRNEEELFAQGLLTKQFVLATRQELFAAMDEHEKSRAALRDLDVQRLAVENTTARDTHRNAMALAEVERQLVAKESELAFATRVLAPANGRVIEIRTDPGARLRAGEAVAGLQLSDDVHPTLRLVAYVSHTEGKRIRPGMEVRISSRGADRRDLEDLRARVTYVSEFPATAEAMRRVLGSDELARTLSGPGAPFAVYADLDSRRRADVNSGTICTAKIVVERRRPIDMILPGGR